MMFLASYLLEGGGGNWEPFQSILVSSPTAANTGSLPWKAEGSILKLQCEGVGASAALESRLLREEKHFRIGFCVWWTPGYDALDGSIPSFSILILKKKRELKKTQTIL